MLELETHESECETEAEVTRRDGFNCREGFNYTDRICEAACKTET